MNISKRSLPRCVYHFSGVISDKSTGKWLIDDEDGLWRQLMGEIDRAESTESRLHDLTNNIALVRFPAQCIYFGSNDSIAFNHGKVYE